MRRVEVSVVVVVVALIHFLFFFLLYPRWMTDREFNWQEGARSRARLPTSPVNPLRVTAKGAAGDGRCECQWQA